MNRRLRWRLRQAWKGWTGDNERTLLRLQWQVRQLINYEVEAAKVPQLRHELEIARAGIKELQAQLPKDWESLRKKESDAITEAVLKDMKDRPERYVDEH